MVPLRREFENLSPALTTLAKRWVRGDFKRADRPAGPSTTDDRGTVVRAIENAQTFLTEQQVDKLVAQYRQGHSLRDLAAAFGVHPRTVTEHLARRGEPMRPRGLQAKFVGEATRLYGSGMPLVEVGRKFGVSQGAVRHALASRGVEIRPRGRIPAVQ